MILMKDIIREGNPLLREKSVDVELPLSNEDEDILNDMIEYIDNSIDEEVEKLIAERQAARKEKNFQLADEIRAKIEAMGIELLDTREGVVWKRK